MIQYRNPTLKSHPSAIWDYQRKGMDAIELGTGVVVMAHAEIVAYKTSPLGSKEGRLILGDNVVIGPGANIRAAGGTIKIGRDSGIAEHSVLVAVGHTLTRGPHIRSRWDYRKVDVIIGENVWVGAGSCLLPGTRIGDNSVVGAGSVVTGEIPPNEIWAGVPARKLRNLEPEGTPAATSE